MVEKAIHEILTKDPAITAIVADRVFADFARQGLGKPYIVYGRASTVRLTHLGGTAGLVQARIDLTMVGASYGVLVSLGTEVREALAAFQGTKKGVTIQNITFDDEWSKADRGVAGGDKAVFLRMIDMIVWYEETPVALHA